MARKKQINDYIYSFEGLDINKLVEKHIELLSTNGKGYINPDPYYPICDNRDKAEFQKRELLIQEWEKSEAELISKIKVPKKNKQVLAEKYTFLIHQTIYYYISLYKKTQIFYLSSEMLDDVLGDDYKIMIDTLYHMSIMEVVKGYILFNQFSQYVFTKEYRSKIYKINNSNIKVKNYIEKANLYHLSNNKEKIKNNYEKFYGKDDNKFISTYLKNINKLKLYDSPYLKPYFEKHKFKSNQRKYNQEELIFKINNFKKIIYQIDDNGRIYYVLTSLKKLLKNLLNIKFSIDTKNSQPLLLNNQLINYYDINFDFIKIINSYSSLNSYIYYVPQLLDNYNKTNKKSVPLDVALYLYVTMKGLFWDESTDTFPKYTRTDVKIEMFKDIFFGKRHGHKWSEFAESFMGKYPNVYSIINNKLKKESYKDLSAILTQTESKIFHSILTKLFDMGIEAVNLHDSIVVLDTPNNENVTEEMIIGIMEEVYYEHSIIPSFSTEYFSVTQFEEEVKKAIQ